MLRIIFFLFIFIAFSISGLSAATDDKKAEVKEEATKPKAEEIKETEVRLGSTETKTTETKAEAEKKEIPISISSKGVTGQVGGISKDYIGVIYRGEKDTDYEMGIYIEGDLGLDRVQDVDEIQVGDTVAVKYDEVSTAGEDGKEVTRHVAKKITLLKKAPPPPIETDTMISSDTKE